MHLLLKASDRSNGGEKTQLPEGVRVIEVLTSGYTLVDATDVGAQALRGLPHWVVEVPGVAFIAPPNDFDHYSFGDIQRKLLEAKARRAKQGLS